MLGTGVLKPKYGAQRVEVHPDSGVRFTGLQVPFWNEVLELCRGAARICPNLRSIGWDIAIAPGGPMIIEANHKWDPQNADGRMGERLRFMASRTSRFRFAEASWSSFVFGRDL